MKHKETVDKGTLADIVFKLPQEQQLPYLEAICKADPAECDVIHQQLIRIFDDNVKPAGTYEDPDEFWENVEAETLKINGLIALHHRSSGAVSYVIRDLSNTGAREYLDLNTKANAKDYLQRMGIKLTFTLRDLEPKKQKPLDIFERWCHQPLTEEQAIIGFVKIPWSPGAESRAIIDRKMNVWHSGFARPKKGLAHLPILKFIKEVPCGNDEYAYDVAIKWLADLVQRPQRKNNLCLVCYSEARGLGKTTLATIIHLLCGSYNSTLDADAKDLEGFDALLAGKLFVNFDETTFSGDHSQLNKLKKRITSGTERNELKGKDARSSQSFCRFLITTNSAEGTMGSAFERRFFDLPISPRWKDENLIDPFIDAHFLKLDVAEEHLRNGIYEIEWVRNLTHFLLNEVDLTGFNFNDVKSGMVSDDIISNRIDQTLKENPIFGWLWSWLNSGEDAISLPPDKYLKTDSTFAINQRLNKEGFVKFGGEITTESLYDIFAEQTKKTWGPSIGRNSFSATLKKKYKFGKGKNRHAKMTFMIPGREALYDTMFNGSFGMKIKYKLPPLRGEELSEAYEAEAVRLKKYKELTKEISVEIVGEIKEKSLFSDHQKKLLKSFNV